ncbi:hypothetical protein [Wansuia hejianensis]|uniref:Uncharacterized protein n=1 Tax=Wansuia hejianensis TaxID=2763667 RepID=A0A926F0K4_9FIRM|nr:hypothetical protein [Wansuia hejianensis]MBC8589675.1 hypothetical protein [Wansuia hejianensis]
MKLKWNTSELNINDIPNGYFEDLHCKELIKKCLLESEHEFGEEGLKLYPIKTSIYIDDSGRIDSSTNLSEYLEYYSSKQNLGTDNYLLIMREERCIIEKLDNYSDMNSIYKEMVSSIIIDVPNVNKSLLNFSPLIFDCIQDKLRENNINIGKELDFVIQFLSMIPIADKVCYDKDTKIYSFIFMDSKKDKKSSIELKWKEYEKFSNTFFYKSYSWIISDKNKGIGIDVKRSIINNYLNNMENLEMLTTLSEGQVNDMVSHFDDILKMVIENRTKEYFDNKKMMKEEFVGLFSKSDELYSDIVKRILSLIAIIAAGIYGVIFVDGKVFDWANKNRNMAILFIVFLIGEIFISCSFVIDIISFQKYKHKLKDIYGVQLLMDTKEWDKVMKTRSYLFPIISLIIVILGTGVVIRHFW